MEADAKHDLPDEVFKLRRDDILIWRYKKEKLEELGPFADSLLGFASHFVPAVREGASRIGLLPSPTKKRGWFGKG